MNIQIPADAVRNQATKQDRPGDGNGQLVFGAIMPHGPDIIAENSKEPELMRETRAAMEEASRRFAAANVDTVILIEPRIIHELQTIALAESRSFFFGDPMLSIGTAAQAKDSLDNVSECYQCDVALAEALLDAGKKASLPVLADPGKGGTLCLEWGAFIPLWFTVHPLAAPRPQVLLIAPSATVPRDELLRFGRLIVEVIRNSGKRVALIASADQGHRHDPNHPRFGFSPAAKEHDAIYCDAIANNQIQKIYGMSDQLLEDSFTDSLWQTLILAGAVSVESMELGYFSYTLPSYFGMAVAVFEPATRRDTTK